MSNQVRSQKINDLLNEAYRDGKKAGLDEGLFAMERMLIWWESNYKLKEPRPLHKLMEWSHKEIQRLQSELEELENQ